LATAASAPVTKNKIDSSYDSGCNPWPNPCHMDVAPGHCKTTVDQKNKILSGRIKRIGKPVRSREIEKSYGNPKTGPLFVGQLRP
jgi:hypothetical protein